MDHTRRGPGGGAAAALLLAVSAALALMTVGGLPSTVDVPDPSLPSLPPAPRDSEAVAVAVVQEFALAIARHDASAVMATMGDPVRAIDTPGFALLDSRVDPHDVLARVEVLVAVADLALGTCQVQPPGLPVGVDWIVTCPEARFDGPFLAAMVEHDRPGVWFSVAGGRIVAFGDQASYGWLNRDLCLWADSVPGAAGAFDLSCRPGEQPKLATGLDLAARSWIAAGRPTAPPAEVRSRVQLGVVERFLAGLDGDRSAAAMLVHPEFDVASTPGHLGGAGRPPPPSAFVRWFGAVYDPVSEECVAAASNRVTCDVAWSSTVVRAAGVVPEGRLSFTVRDGLVAGIAGEDPGIGGWVEDFCGWLASDRPAVHRYAVLADCSPVYTGWAADAFVRLAPVFADA